MLDNEITPGLTFASIVLDIVDSEIKTFASCNVFVGNGEVRVYKGTGVSRGVRRTTWERSLKNGSSNSPVLKSFLLGRDHFGTRPFQSPSLSGIRLYFVRPHFPSPKFETTVFIFSESFRLAVRATFCERQNWGNFVLQTSSDSHRSICGNLAQLQTQKRE